MQAGAPTLGGARATAEQKFGKIKRGFWSKAQFSNFCNFITKLRFDVKKLFC